MTFSGGPLAHDDPATRDANIAVVRALVDDVVNGRDDSRLDEVLADDFVAHDLGPGMPPGKEGMRTLLRVWRRAFPDWTDTIQDVIAQGDLVVIRVRATGTHLGPIAGIAPTGRPVAWDIIEILRVREGRITEQWGQSSFATVLDGLRAATGGAPT